VWYGKRESGQILALFNFLTKKTPSKREGDELVSPKENFNHPKGLNRYNINTITMEYKLDRGAHSVYAL